MRTWSAGIAAAVMLGLYCAAPGALAADRLAQARKLSVPAKVYPELARIHVQLDALISSMETNAGQLKTYRKARVRATDRRYSGLTQSLNRSRTQISELERKLEKAPALDVSRRSISTGGDRGSASSTSGDQPTVQDIRKYDQAKANLKQCLKLLSAHYDQQLRDIAKVR